MSADSKELRFQLAIGGLLLYRAFHCPILVVIVVGISQ